jgi:hypothetical protein
MKDLQRSKICSGLGRKMSQAFITDMLFLLSFFFFNFHKYIVLTFKPLFFFSFHFSLKFIFISFNLGFSVMRAATYAL